MITLMPRLPKPAADFLLDGFLNDGPDEWTGFDANNLPEATRFAATGGSPAGTEQLIKLRQSFIEIAERNGFRTEGTQNNFARFDAEIAMCLVNLPLFSSGEGL